ncbi:MAG TPA: hypothetical protein DEV59_08540 [Proteus sp.]|uniref:hypothetical protein n=1 Tax=Proteus hauseri TaxID=183417 RepID=UPI000EBCF625|nr:hypothetical protein [Proteus hauseri]QAV24916.1 hypothetical protein PH4a_16865 [Proteus hauseri]HCH50719.1 hypothetical protein [Proteus sp. (in: enterobacteria)]
MKQLFLILLLGGIPFTVISEEKLRTGFEMVNKIKGNICQDSRDKERCEKQVVIAAKLSYMEGIKSKYCAVNRDTAEIKDDPKIIENCKKASTFIEDMENTLK